MTKFLAITVAIIGVGMVLIWALATAMQLLVLLTGLALLTVAAVIFLKGTAR